MPGIESFATTAAPYLALALILIAASCIVAALVNGYRAGWIWLHRKTPISDPMIAKALEGIKPPAYWLYAIAWGGFGVLAFCCAIGIGYE